MLLRVMSNLPLVVSLELLHSLRSLLQFIAELISLTVLYGIFCLYIVVSAVATLHTIHTLLFKAIFSLHCRSWAYPVSNNSVLKLCLIMNTVMNISPCWKGHALVNTANFPWLLLHLSFQLELTTTMACGCFVFSLDSPRRTQRAVSF